MDVKKEENVGAVILYTFTIGIIEFDHLVLREEEGKNLSFLPSFPLFPVLSMKAKRADWPLTHPEPFAQLLLP